MSAEIIDLCSSSDGEGCDGSSSGCGPPKGKGGEAEKGRSRRNVKPVKSDSASHKKDNSDGGSASSSYAPSQAESNAKRSRCSGPPIKLRSANHQNLGHGGSNDRNSSGGSNGSIPGKSKANRSRRSGTKSNHQERGSGGSGDFSSESSSSGEGHVPPRSNAKKSCQTAFRSAPFLHKLTNMLTDDNRSVIEWSSHSNSGCIEIHDPRRLEEKVLGRYFGRWDYAHFRKRLNVYGFLSGKGGNMIPRSFVNEATTRDIKSLLLLKDRSRKKKPLLDSVNQQKRGDTIHLKHDTVGSRSGSSSIIQSQTNAKKTQSALPVKSYLADRQEHDCGGSITGNNHQNLGSDSTGNNSSNESSSSSEGYVPPQSIAKRRQNTAESSVPEFLQKLMSMLTDDNRSVIEWTSNSNSGCVEIHDPRRLESEVLGKYFRHSNYESFKKQLNNYGFRIKAVIKPAKMGPRSYVNEAVTQDINSLLLLKKKKWKKKSPQDSTNQHNHVDTSHLNLGTGGSSSIRYVRRQSQNNACNGDSGNRGNKTSCSDGVVPLKNNAETSHYTNPPITTKSNHQKQGSDGSSASSSSEGVSLSEGYVPPQNSSKSSCRRACGTASKFLHQLMKMLTDDNRSVIEWCSHLNSGCIEIHDPKRLEREVLGKYFPHLNYVNFNKRLNYYGFRNKAGRTKKIGPRTFVNEAVTKDIKSLLVLKAKKWTKKSPPHSADQRKHADNDCDSSDDDDIISVYTAKCTQAVKTNDERNSRKRVRVKCCGRRYGGYHLKEGERIVWITEIEGGSPHQAIIHHPQPPNALSDEHVYVQWLHSNVAEWIPKSNIQDEYNTLEGEKPKRKRSVPKRYADSLAPTKNSDLVKKQASKQAVSNDDHPATKGEVRKTCCASVEFANPQGRAMGKVPPGVEKSIEKACVKVIAAPSISEPPTADLQISYDDAWDNPFDNSRKNDMKQESIHHPPIPLISNDDDQSIPSIITLILPDHSDVESLCVERIGNEGSDSHDQRSAARDGCHICDGQLHHHRQVDILLRDIKAAVADVDADISGWADFVRRFKVLIQGIDDDFRDGASFFFHQCEFTNGPNPIFTMVKLVQLFHEICEIISKASNEPQPDMTLFQLCFQPWKKKSPKDCGVVIQMLQMATAIINARVDLDVPETPARIDQLVGVTFGLQLLQNMARNVYADSKSHLQRDVKSAALFLDHPLQSHKCCIKMNCQLGQKRLTSCALCGVSFHKGCFTNNNEENSLLGDHCPCCKASSLLLDAADTDDCDIFSLIVEKAASPFIEGTAAAGNETALHIALRTNNYDLASMLLYGSHLLLNSDDSLLEWTIPDIAWARARINNQNNKGQTPFEYGTHLIKQRMDARPPVEIMLLLCSRGATQSRNEIQDALHKRRKMMMVMKEMNNIEAVLEHDISEGLEPSPVPAIMSGESTSMYDAKTQSNLFTYLTNSVESRSIAIRWFDCRIGRKQLSPFPGNCTAENRMVLHQRQLIPPTWKCYCNSLCKEANKCECQAVQKGVLYRLEVFETTDGRGLGVRTPKGTTIKKGSIICHYAGEIISSKEARRREDAYARQKIGSYILDCDEKRQYCIDATQYRSVAALINHSCAGSNSKLYRVLGNHLDLNFPFLGLEAKEDIKPLTEITFNYGEKPQVFCAECNGSHCLCSHCKTIAHKK
ncbi:hypothetical protein ACHAWF_017183 [Thalassiosira exigua]